MDMRPMPFASVLFLVGAISFTLGVVVGYALWRLLG